MESKTQPTLFSPGELQRCLLCGGEYEPAREGHACEIESDWVHCYRDSWKGLITPDAFAHPAKFSRSLIHRIYAHAKEEGWLVPGSTVIDPFGGVALGGLEAAWHGAHWVGCELEQKFVALGQKNIALWQARFGHMGTWGSVRLVQGDSRQLSTVLERAGLCVSSPPFGEAVRGAGIMKDGYSNKTHDPAMKDRQYSPDAQGTTHGNLSALPATDTGLRIAISSPPYAQSLERPNGIDADKIQRPGGSNSQSVTDPRYGTSAGQLGAMRDRGPSLVVRHSISLPYGTSPGQLGAMVVSSPPFEGSLHGADGKVSKAAQGVGRSYGGNRGRINESYGNSEGQLGDSTGNDFWTAARAIVAQTYTVLAPNSHAIWVLKGFIRKKQYVDFPDQWRLLCEACGFTTLHWHRCWLVEPGDAQTGMLGGRDVDYTRERKSFFRRLAERKGSPRIDFEVVLCMLKR